MVFWKRFNVIGVLWGSLIGLISVFVFVLMSFSVWDLFGGVIFIGNLFILFFNLGIIFILFGFFGVWFGMVFLLNKIVDEEMFVEI